MSAPEQLQLLLPLSSWTEDAHLVTKTGAKLKRWGSVQDACKILAGCDRQVIYDLYRSKQIAGFKNNPQASNSHLRIDLLSVWEHKQRQLV